MGEDGYFRCCRTLNLDLLDLLGPGYLVDHALAELADAAEQRRLYAYVTDALMALCENTARPHGGRRLTRRWIDPAPTPTTPEAAAKTLIQNAHLTFKPPTSQKAPL